MQAQKELDALKAEKKEIRSNLKIVEDCKQEFKQFPMLDLVSVEDEVSNTVRVPEYPYETKRVTGEELVEKVSEVPFERNVEAPVETVDAEVTIEEVTPVEVEPAEMNVQDVTDEEQDSLLSYESFKRMTPEDKAKSLGFIKMRDYDTVQCVVSVFFGEMKHHADIDEIMEETALVYKGMRRNFIEQRVNEIVQEINTREIPYLCLTDTEKAELFRFKPEDNSYNLELHSAVLKAFGVRLELDDVYEDYQKIYDKTVKMQEEKEIGRGDSGRGRAR